MNSTTKRLGVAAIAMACLVLSPMGRTAENEDDLCPRGTIPVIVVGVGFVGCVNYPEPAPLPEGPEPPEAPPDDPYRGPGQPPGDDDEEQEEDELEDCAGLREAIQTNYDICMQAAKTKALKCATGKDFLTMLVCAHDKVTDDRLCEDYRANLLAALPSSCRGG